ncbi:MAG: ion channel, partial [Myxococcota bacterium]
MGCANLLSDDEPGLAMAQGNSKQAAWARDGTRRFEQRGRTYRPWEDGYHLLLTASWSRFIALLFGGFIVFNLCFAALYRLGGDCIGARDPASWWLAFSFSVQTMAAIGYGVLAPTTPYAYAIANLEGFLGLLVFAMASGLMFARFSRPSTRVVFSRVAVVHPRDGVPMFQFRVSNERGNQLVDAKVHVTALIDEETSEGHRLRRLVDLPLVRSSTPMFSLSWVVMHPLNEDSPLARHLSEQGSSSQLVTVVVTLTGLDDSSVQTVYARTNYAPEDV